MADIVDNPLRYNSLLIRPNIHLLIKYFVRTPMNFDSARFIGEMSDLRDLPSISVRELLKIAKSAGVNASGYYAEIEEMVAHGPFLTYLKREEDDTITDLVCIEEIRSRIVVFRTDGFRTRETSRKDLVRRWSGVVIVADRRESTSCLSPELDKYERQTSLISGFLTHQECSALIDYCEHSSFRRSKVGGQVIGSAEGVVSIKERSSSSVVLEDRNHPILSTIYDRCAEIEGCNKSLIETIQCVRYKRTQRFKTHFDGGVDLPRRTTFLIYLNNNFEGGETYFPLLERKVAPHPGTCLRFPSCTADGRIIYQSEHGGLPVLEGTKYALNVWVRCASESYPAST